MLLEKSRVYRRTRISRYKKVATNLNQVPTLIDVVVPAMYELPEIVMQMKSDITGPPCVVISAETMQWITSTVAKQYIDDSTTQRDFVKNRSGYRPHRCSKRQKIEGEGDEDARDVDVGSDAQEPTIEPTQPVSQDANEDADSSSTVLLDQPELKSPRLQSNLHRFFKTA